MSDSSAGTVFYRIAMLCSILPMTVSVAIYLLYEMTRWPLGLAILFAGFASLVWAPIGFVCIIAYVFRRRTENADPWHNVLGRAMKPVGLVVLNVLVCLVVLFLYQIRYTNFTVVLENEGVSTITRFEIEGPGVKKVIENVAPGQSKPVHMYFNSDGILTYKAEVGDSITEGTIEDFVHEAGSGKSVVIFSDTAFSAQRIGR